MHGSGLSDAATVAEFRRGWKALIGCSVGVGFGLSGLPFYCFSVFVIPLAEAFGWTRGETTRASSLLVIGTAITAPIIGTIIDRYGARRVGLISMVGVAMGFFALSQLNGSLTVYYLIWIAMALAGGGTTPVVFTRTIGMWFNRARGTALGLTLAGSGLSGIVGPSLVTALIRDYGWQGGYIGLGILVLVIALPVMLVLFKDRDEAQTQTLTQTAPTPERSGLTLQQAIRTRDFWQISLGFIVVSAMIAALLLNLVPLLRDRGLSPEAAAGLAGVMAFAVLVGRVVVGGLVDRFGGKMVARVLLSITAGGCLLLALPNTPSWVPFVSVISLGFATAAEVDLVAFLTARYFGMKAYGKIYGWQITSFYLGAAMGSLGAGFAYDILNGYVEMLYFAAGSLVFGAIVVGSLRDPPNFAD